MDLIDANDEKKNGPETYERVTTTYLVTLVVPTNCFGQIEVDADSEEQAGRLAIERQYQADWECARLRLHGSEVEVLEIELIEGPEAEGEQPYE